MPGRKLAEFPLELPEPLDISEILKAYLAGFFDADISINIKESGYTSYTLHIGVELRLSDVRILELYQKYFSGRISDVSEKGSKRWERHGEDTALLLVTIYPYLRLKRREAQYGLAFYQKYPTIPANQRYELCERYMETLSSFHDEIKEVEPFGELTAEVQAYLAGYLDGDGTVVAAYSKTSRFTRVTFSGNITDVEQFKCIKNLFGGYIHRIKGTKDIRIQLPASGTVRVLKATQPYLFLKNEQCRLSLQFDKEYKALPRFAKKEKEQLYQKYKAELHSLNQREIIVPADSGKYD